MNTPKIKSFKRIIPMIYAYTTPNDISHAGWTKIGYTARQTVEDRIRQQSHTVDAKVKLLWKGNARYEDGSDETFTDHEFHDYLTQKRHVKRKPNTEWFHIDGPTSHQYFHEFADRDYGVVQGKDKHVQYQLRKEQQAAVDDTIAYFRKHGEGSEYLWNAKPRFGKTLSTYDLVCKMQMQNVLVVTNRPSIANSWFDDFEKFIAWRNKFKFVSENEALKNRPVLSHQEFDSISGGKEYGQIVFESLQGLKRSVYFGGDSNATNLKWIRDLNWDLLIIDEAHEGVDTYKTDKAFDKIERRYTLHLTGTPFKAIAKGKFSSDQIYNWSYADEQKAKADWNEDIEGESNPYAVMPRLNMFTYQLSEMMADTLKQGVALENGDKADPAFDLNEFFRTENGRFVYDDAIDHFLDMLTTGEKYPFSTPELRQQLAHTFWLLNRVDSAKALAKKLKLHPVFKNYYIVLAAGDGKLDDDQLDDEELDRANAKSFDRVKDAISKYDKTITLSVGQLTTGVTVKEWSGVLMLSSMKSASEYMQAAFRAQNPCQFEVNGQLVQKENAYVFDFDPTRTLTIFDEFANNLLTETSNGKGTAAEREANIRKLLNFFPVIGEDDHGKMVELDAKQVMSIPRRLKSQEVVRRGFMSNFLFANISRVFSAPAEVRDIFNKLPITKEGKATRTGQDAISGAEDVSVDEDGNVVIPKERVIGKSKELFGNKIYSDLGKDLEQSVSDVDPTDFNEAAKKVSDQVNNTINKQVIDTVAESYGLTKKEVKRHQRQLNKESEQVLHRIADAMNDQKKVAEAKFDADQKAARDENELHEAKSNYESSMKSILSDFSQKINEQVQKTVSETPAKVIERVENNKEESNKSAVEEDARAHLRGFSRTIPSFIMAYGDRQLTLQNFDKYTEDDVFEDVADITEDEFRFLRDGGYYTDEDTGERKYFEGHLFDEGVFNDSVQQFLDKKEELKNYFDDNNKEDIFDYIPPQKTNQIFTPKVVVKHMVDDLEANNPGIFDDPNKTFADLYMNSGLYITEIVKRLFQSKKMKQLFPDDHERIKHIFEHQVYGLAPTRIIYLISTNYIFGFNAEIRDELMSKHFKQIDAAQYSKEGKLEDIVRQEFGE